MTKESSGHWYLQDGTQLLTVPRKKDGEPIKTTLAHAKKRGDLAPGCTTIIKEASAPQLTNWMVQQGILAALTLPRGDDEPEAEWLRRVEKDRQATGREAAEEGNRIHHALEFHFNGLPFHADLPTAAVDHRSIDYIPEEAAGHTAYARHVDAVVDMLAKEFPCELFRPEQGVTHSIGFGTKSDLHSPNVLLDWKGKETGTKGLPKFTYSSHWLQLAATRAALMETFGYTAMRAGICYVSRDVPGDVQLVMLTEEQLEKGWQAFQCLMLHWQTMNNYAPNWARRLRITQEAAA